MIPVRVHAMSKAEVRTTMMDNELTHERLALIQESRSS
jgi:hypothetical protein